MDTMRWRDDVSQDLKYALRMLRRTPGFTAAAVVALALGIGANTAMFSVVNAVLLRPLRAPDADRIFRFTETYQGTPSWVAGLRTFNTWRQQTAAFEDISAHWLEFANLTSASYPEQIPVARVTAGFFRLFGAQVIKGRTFTEEEDRPGGATSVVVLSREFWTRQFGADADIVGKVVSLGGVSRVVVGILGGGFDTEQFDQRPDVWVPFQIDPSTPERGTLCFTTGRLKPGVALSAARAQLQAAAEEWRKAGPGPATSTAGFAVVPLREAMVGEARPALVILAGAVGLVLLIACANVANLLLVRAVGRRREMAIRTAIGASRRRIVRQLLTESMLLAAAGGLFGIVLGVAGIGTLLAQYPGNNPLILANRAASLPRIGQDASAITLDWRVLLFTVVMSMLTGILFGLLPAVQACRTDVGAALKQADGTTGSGSRGSRVRGLLVVSEIAIALTLLIGAGLLIRTSLALLAVNRGFDLHNVLTLRMSVSGTRFETRAGLEQLTRDGSERVRALPGVAVATSACCVPLETVWQLPFVIASRPLTGAFHAFAGWTFVSPGYFEAFNIPLVRGRTFTDRDDAGAPGVVIINAAMARRFWPNDDPLNGQLIVGRSMRPEYKEDPVRQIVGIVGDVRDQGLNRPPRPAMYVPIAQVPGSVTTLNVRLLPLTWIVRTNADRHSLTRRIEAELSAASGGLPVTRIRSMDEVAAESIARTRFDTLLMTVFGLSALFLAAIGIYAIMAFSVRQQSREIGIRRALGAGSSQVRYMVLIHGMRLSLIGVGVGLASAFGLARLLATYLFGVTVYDPVVFVSVPVLLSTVALIAVWFPARRATLVDPAVALRYE
jgi:predicted permease